MASPPSPRIIRPFVLHVEKAQNAFGLGGGTKVSAFCRMEEERTSPSPLHPALEARIQAQMNGWQPNPWDPVRTTRGEQPPPLRSCLKWKISPFLPRGTGKIGVCWSVSRRGQRAWRLMEWCLVDFLPWKSKGHWGFNVLLSVATGSLT